MCLSSKSDTHYPQPAALQNSKTENSGMTWGERAEGRKLVEGHLQSLVNVTEEPISILFIDNYYQCFLVRFNSLLQREYSNKLFLLKLPITVTS
jgi:hypothetical protein